MPPKEASPQVVIKPLASRAAKALRVANTCVKPVPVGAPEPPRMELPQADIEPSALSAAKALLLENT